MTINSEKQFHLETQCLFKKKNTMIFTMIVNCYDYLGNISIKVRTTALQTMYWYNK